MSGERFQVFLEHDHPCLQLPNSLLRPLISHRQDVKQRSKTSGSFFVRVVSIYTYTGKGDAGLVRDLLLLTASRAAKVNWMPAEDVDNHDQDRPGAPSIRLRTMKNEQVMRRARLCPSSNSAASQ